MDGGDKVEKATMQDCRLEKPEPRPQAAIGFIRHVCILAEESNLVESWPFCENEQTDPKPFFQGEHPSKEPSSIRYKKATSCC